MRRSGSPARYVRATGMTLIEVLIALLLFSFCFLGLVGMQAKAVQLSVDGENRTRAAILANEITAAMIMQNTLTPPLGDWQARVQDERTSGLPGSFGHVDPADVDGTVTVTITWHAPSKIATAQDSRYVTQVALP